MDQTETLWPILPCWAQALFSQQIALACSEIFRQGFSAAQEEGLGQGKLVAAILWRSQRPWGPRAVCQSSWEGNSSLLLLKQTAAGDSCWAQPAGSVQLLCFRLPQTDRLGSCGVVGSTECGWEDVWVWRGCVQGTLLSCHLQTNHRTGRRREGVEVAPGALESEERRLD